MKHMFWLLVLTLALPVAAFANSVNFTNSSGTLSGSTAGLSLSDSILIAVNGLGGLGLVTGDLGSLTLSTGALTSGSLKMGGTFAGGGSFVIMGNGTGGIPNGVIFNGIFSGPVTWSLITLGDGSHLYTLTGSLAGTWYTGVTVDGATIQLTVDVGKGFFKRRATIASGDTNISAIPESSTLTLIGAGLVGLAGLSRHKMKKSSVILRDDRGRLA